MVENEENGVFHPQNGEYSNTTDLVKMISGVYGKKVAVVKGGALKIMGHITGLVNKAFGSMSYDMKLSEYKENYRIYRLTESIEKTER